MDAIREVNRSKQWQQRKLAVANRYAFNRKIDPTKVTNKDLDEIESYRKTCAPHEFWTRVDRVMDKYKWVNL